MDTLQASIIADLKVVPAFADQAALGAETQRRIVFIQDCLQNAGLKTLVLGISGGVDSLLAGRLAQLAISALREQSGDMAYHFIAVRLPYHQQQDEADAQASLNFINADEIHTINIADAVNALAGQTHALGLLPPAKRDFVMGNIKARMRMLAQYAIANAHNGLVIGTDHAAEAVISSPLH
jgi:NAD+ synthetase